MIKQPLKNKVNCFDGRPHINGKCFPDCDAYFAVQEVKSAVEWLKEKVFPNQKVINWSQWQIIDLIDEAFPDLCPSGDLIADKQNPPPCPQCHKVEYTPTCQYCNENRYLPKEEAD